MQSNMRRNSRQGTVQYEDKVGVPRGKPHRQGKTSSGKTYWHVWIMWGQQLSLRRLAEGRGGAHQAEGGEAGVGGGAIFGGVVGEDGGAVEGAVVLGEVQPALEAVRAAAADPKPNDVRRAVRKEHPPIIHNYHQAPRSFTVP